MSYLSIVRVAPEKTTPSDDFGCGWSVIPMLTSLSLCEERVLAKARSENGRESAEEQQKRVSVG